ncbi:Rhomboid-like protein 19 [Sesamum angolense]|uniref:Rhomboid-like protein 19 n=1 Tax=Sesamum angolense TaxID=2727404 RepID=A0AAE1X243_9LAMI|nr:Rhomboid-like protein 19 [Sesamum angolense]
MSSPQLSGGGVSIYTGFTRLCKGLAVVLIGGHVVVQIFPSAVSYLALIPAKTIPFAWNLITAGYVEQSIHGVFISTVGLLFIGKLLEPIWGSREFFKFIFVVNFLTSVCVFITAISLYYIRRQESYLYMPISGFQGVLSGFLVGIKQIIPDQELSLLKIKAKWLPSLALLVSVAVSFFTTDSASYLPTPVIDPLATIFERLLCGRRSESSDEPRGYTLGVASLPGSDPVEASRRRERGARALEERLAAERLAAAAGGGRTQDSQRDATENV